MSTIFCDLGWDIIEMISNVLGQTTSEFVDEIIIAFMSIYSPRQPPAIMFDYAKFISNKMHDQFMSMENKRVFKYSSVLYHLFLYYQADKFQFTLQKLDARGNPRSIVFCTSLIHLYDSPYTYTDFIDLFVHLVETMLLGIPPPRIIVDIRMVLHLLKKYSMEDWYLYQNNTEIKIYGCQLAPYKQQRYLPMRLFALEYYKKIINLDEVHFVKAKKKSQLRIKY